MKTFRDLKAGDKVYVVNEGINIGYIRLEEYILEEALHLDEKVFGTYVAKQKDCTWNLIIHESLMDSSNCGFIFTTLEEACELYVKKASEISNKLVDKYNNLQDQLIDLYRVINNIGINIMYSKDKKFDKIIISKQYNENN